MVKLFIALLAVAAISPKDEVRIPIKYSRASLVAIKIQQILETNSGIEADDLAGEIRVFGTEETIAEVRKILALFDVKPWTIRTKWTFSQSVDKIEYDGVVGIRNTTGFTYADSQSVAKVTVTPYLTERRTIRSRVEFESGGAKFQKSFESKIDEQIIALVPEMNPMDDKARSALQKIDKRLWPRMTFKFTPEQSAGK